MSNRDQIPNKKRKTLSQVEFKALAEFRYQIRRYLPYMEEKARARGYHPQQYQLLLAIEGLPEGKEAHDQDAGRAHAVEPQHHGGVAGPLPGRRFAAPGQGRSRPAAGDPGSHTGGKARDGKAGQRFPGRIAGDWAGPFYVTQTPDGSACKLVLSTRESLRRHSRVAER